MKVPTQRATVLAVSFGALVWGSSSFSQTPSPRADNDVLEPVSVKKDLYPSDADAKKEIENALKQAATETKRVLLVFGGNWCYDCHVLDRALHEGAAGKVMKESFLLVHVDVGEFDKNLDLVKEYKTKLDKGVPAVVILSADGSVLYSSNDGEFEAARRMMKKDLVAFLDRWKSRGSSPTGREGVVLAFLLERPPYRPPHAGCPRGDPGWSGYCPVRFTGNSVLE